MKLYKIMNKGSGLFYHKGNLTRTGKYYDRTPCLRWCENWNGYLGRFMNSRSNITDEQIRKDFCIVVYDAVEIERKEF